MPLYALTDGDDITAAYQRFTERLRDGATLHSDLGIGWKGDNGTADIYWQPNAEFWSFAVEEHDRYWFGIGTDNPAPNDAVGDIVVQFGFIKEGTNRKFGGVFAHDEHGALHLLHSGGIGGGRPGISKNPFLDEYIGQIRYVSWIKPKAKVEYIYIAPLEGTNLVERIAAFAREVQAFKNSVTARNGQ